eukprot:TRINITY_DN4142_c1_g2_i3.p1 TRINITY_DN4142_c1_g2~~TRINITY_DN4142_c1_g2_i3.p1  ORF type:complete len:965 (+),score=324.23 TRINITY_DN4142_c1_g2_i3:85-2979(+)
MADNDMDADLDAAIALSLQEDAPEAEGGIAPGTEIRCKPPGKNGTYSGVVRQTNPDGSMVVQFRGIDDPITLPPGHHIDDGTDAAPPAAAAAASPSAPPAKAPPAPKPEPISPPSDPLTLSETEELLKEDPEKLLDRMKFALAYPDRACWLWFDAALHEHQQGGDVAMAPAEQDIATPGEMIGPSTWLGRAGSFHMNLDDAPMSPTAAEGLVSPVAGRRQPAVPPLGLDWRRSRPTWEAVSAQLGGALAVPLRELALEMVAQAATGRSSEGWLQVLKRERTTLHGMAQPYAFTNAAGAEYKDAMPYLTWRLARLFALLLDCPTVFSDIECKGALCLALARTRQYVSPALAHLLSQYRSSALGQSLDRLQSFLSTQITEGLPALPGTPPKALKLIDAQGEALRFESGTRLGLTLTFYEGTRAKCKALCWDPDSKLLRTRMVLDKDTGGDRRPEVTTTVSVKAEQAHGEQLEVVISKIAAMASAEGVYHNLRMGPHCGAVAATIGVLYDASFLWRAHGVLGFEHFYSDDVCKNMDAEVEVHRWLTRAKKNDPEDGFTPESFTFAETPYLLNPAFKAEILSASSRAEQRQQVERGGVWGMIFGGVENMFLHLKIDRSSTGALIESTLQQLAMNGDKIRYPLRVSFTGHAGLDAGGLRKEWLQLLQAAIFSPSYGMFTEDPETKVTWFQPRVICSDCDRQFNAIGQLLGLALYNGLILDVNFPPVCYKLLLGFEPELSDLKQLDYFTYKGLKQLLEYREEGEATVEAVFGLDFSVTHEVFGAVQVVELKPGGESIPVTAENRAEYAHLVVEYKCQTSIGKNFKEFKEGFLFVCGAQESVLRMLRPEELERMVMGTPDIDLSQLKVGARYEGYDPSNQTVKYFWEIVDELKDERTQRHFLRFCTGTDRVPIHGLNSYSFTVMRLGDDSEDLPSASTCFYVLKLPEYKTKEKLYRKLMLAITECTGFGLE